MLKTSILSLLLLLLPACDTTTTHGGSDDPLSAADAGAEETPDDDPNDDPSDCGGDLGTSCSEISACADTCGTDTGCITDCKAAGCPDGVDAFDAVFDCVVANCAVDCAGGYTTECGACVDASCSNETAACDVQECAAAGCDDDPQDDPEDDPEDPTSAGSCLEILTCKSGCSPIDISCSDACKMDMCDEALSAAQAVETCGLLHCFFDCLDQESPECTSCVTSSCSEELTTCTATSCP